MVIEFFATFVYARRRGAVSFQFAQAPTHRPMAIHVWLRPDR